jgi:hypothetical protein
MGPTATKIGSWIYIFSKFTPEALLFEAFVILGLLACYMAFWVLRKRRMGSIENAVPAGLVKVYLNQLIGEAEQLRAQLFGLLTGTSPDAGNAAALRVMTPDLLASISAQLPASGTAPAGGGDSKALSALEAKMNEQAKAMEAVLVEKKRIEKELADAKAAGAQSAKGGAPVDDGMIAKLQEKIRILEGKLAEYSVIEDDLANLKRLQQENVQLRAALEKSGGKAAATPAKPAAAAEPAPAPEATPAAEAKAATSAPAPEPVPIPTAAKEVLEAEPEPKLTVEASPEPAADVAPAAPGPREEAGFESLVDEVEKSIQESPAPAAAEAGEPAVESAPGSSKLDSILTSAGAPAGSPSQEKTDADLVAEFEKMLKG